MTARKADLAGLQDQLTRVRAEAAEQADIEKQLNVARDALKTITQQRADLDKAVIDSTAKHDQLAAEMIKAQSAMDGLQSQLAQLNAQAAQRNGDLSTLNLQLEKAHQELADLQSQIAAQRQTLSKPVAAPPAAGSSETPAAGSSETPPATSN